MNISGILKRMLEEEVERKYQAHFDSLYSTNWNPSFKEMFNTEEDLPLDKAENMYKTYRAIMAGKNIKVENEIVRQFLNKNDGNYNTRKLTLVDLQNFERLTLKEFTDLLKDFNKEVKISPNSEEEDSNNMAEISRKKLKEIFDENDVQVTPRKIEESKKLWYNTSNAMINEGAVRVYAISSLEQSIRMGYYYQYIHAKNITRNENVEKFNEHLRKYGSNKYIGMNYQYRIYGLSKPWCTTMRGEKVFIKRVLENGEFDDRTRYDYIHYPNQYRNYRTGQRFSFYYIIDDSREEDDPYFMSSLEYSYKNDITLTSQYNDNEVSKSWEEIVEIFPQLKNYRDLFVYKDFDESEMGSMAVNELDLINENENSQYFFGRQNRLVQDAYVSAGKLLTKVISWQMTNPNVRKKYLNNIHREDYLRKIDNFNLLQEILSRDVDNKILDVQMKFLGFTNGYKEIANGLFYKEYKIEITNLLNDNLSLYANRTNPKKIGLYNKEEAKWYTKDGITYDDKYQFLEKNKKFLKILPGKNYFYYAYTIGDSLDDRTLYCIVTDMTVKKGYIFTHKGFNQMLSDMNVTNLSGMGKILSRDIDVDKDVDIKEEY